MGSIFQNPRLRHKWESRIMGNYFKNSCTADSREGKCDWQLSSSLLNTTSIQCELQQTDSTTQHNYSVNCSRRTAQHNTITVWTAADRQHKTTQLQCEMQQTDSTITVWPAADGQHNTTQHNYNGNCSRRTAQHNTITVWTAADGQHKAIKIKIIPHKSNIKVHTYLQYIFHSSLLKKQFLILQILQSVTCMSLSQLTMFCVSQCSVFTECDKCARTSVKSLSNTQFLTHSVCTAAHSISTVVHCRNVQTVWLSEWR